MLSCSCRTNRAPSKADHFVQILAVLIWPSTVFFMVFALASCSPRSDGSAELQSLTPANGATVDDGVRTFMHTVAHDVTQDGPLVWLKFFDTGPAFFMAVNGKLAFPNANAAEGGTRDFARTIKRIELTWGDDLRVDPLTADLAVVATSWREVQVDKAGHRIEEAGYFTGLAQYRGGRWQFRNTHWSAPINASER
jgi:hypothetical protein